MIKLSRFNFSIKYLKYIYRISIPLYPVVIAGVVFSQIDRVIISNLVGQKETGLYSYAYTIGSISGLFIISLKSAWEPIMMDFLNKSRNDSVGLFTNVLNLFICLITSSLILSCKEFSSILAPDNFQSSILITPIILFSTFFSFQDTIYQNYILYCKEKIYKISLITIFIGVLKVILNLILIPKFGYLSAGSVLYFVF